MDKKIFLFIGTLLWFVSVDAVDVLRLIPLAGTEQDVPVASLRKVVFTADSLVFVSSTPELPKAVYKYDYSSMLFVASGEQGIERTDNPEPPESTKFIQDGRLYIRRDNTIYDILGIQFNKP